MSKEISSIQENFTIGLFVLTTILAFLLCCFVKRFTNKSKQNYAIVDICRSCFCIITSVFRYTRRIWKTIYNGRDSSEDLSENIDMLSNDFPLTRLLASLDLVVAYSKEFINELYSSPKLKGKQKRYALILKSASPEAKAEIERYFSSVVEDVLTVHQCV
ncbi:uncharacterized protein LOC124451677 [Xenia sp. Carnegie-2017]|uniref:uncharacterized protein LOC124451677 n=1 Tax=Xenia sp. Carnegie-2017 TaxID=2897299 RepID=UPI001F04E723|nr:uncharacterized protein LOC124451677 [Xenia sp. Carnegie-2017]